MNRNLRIILAVFTLGLSEVWIRFSRKIAIGVTAAVFVLLGISSALNPKTSGSIATPTPSADESRCLAVSAQKLESILPLTAYGGGTLRDAYAVKSLDFSKVWFIAAEMDFEGGEGDGEIGVWATNDLEPIVGFFSVNGLALEFTDWADGPSSDAQLSMSDDGASEAEECVKDKQ
jgi:hypothetical protein